MGTDAWIAFWGIIGGCLAAIATVVWYMVHTRPPKGG